MQKFKHTPVLLKEVIEQLRIKPGEKYIDATLGGGGYSFEIAKLGGVVLGIDLDPDAIQFVKEKIKDHPFDKLRTRKSKIKNLENIVLVRGNFRDIKKIAQDKGFEKVSGIVFDLGISSYQIEQSGRGFSFSKDEPLDMRMDSSGNNALTAAIIINTWKEEELYELIAKKGEEHFARPIVHNIIRARRLKPINSSLELARLVEEVVPRIGMIHPATKVFQALRITVNNELENLKKGLQDSVTLLRNNGRIAVVSFHSLEDRIVKLSFQEFEKSTIGRLVTKKPILSSDEEKSKNKRSRSAKMRVFEVIES